MEQSQRIFVVIPSYNEGGVLARTVSEVVSHGFEVVVVDDGSVIPAAIQLAGLPVWCIRHAANLGQGAALQTGTDHALAMGADIIIHFDADGQHSAAAIRKLAAPIVAGEADVVLGSRFIDASDRQLVPFKKRVLLKAGVFVSWAFTGVWLTDTHNGFRALSRNAAQQIRLTENGFAHATEILERIHRRKLRYVEVPTTISYTEYSQAKGQSVLNSVNIVFDLLVRKLLP